MNEYLNAIISFISKLFNWWVIIHPWEEGVRVRGGKRVKVIKKGAHFKIPFFDSVFVQTTRLRVVSLNLQTITSKDGQTLTIVAVVGYSIKNILLLYNTLYQPETTISNMVMSELSDFVANHNFIECRPNAIEIAVYNKLNSSHGINFEYVKIIGFAQVKTYRIIQDGHYTPQESLSMESRK